MYTRRPIANSTALVNYQPVSSIYTKNSLTITRGQGGRIQVVEINDGHVKKTLTLSYDGSNRISGFSAEVTPA